MSQQQNASWEETREKVLSRDGHECRFCGIENGAHRQETGRELHVHHIIPKSDGGPDTMQNLVALCQSCHRTMESLHGQAIGEIGTAKDYSDDLTAIATTWREFREEWDDYDGVLWQFADSNPVFRGEFGIHNEEETDVDPAVYSHTLSEYAEEIDGEITSEWEFVAKYGYIRGVIEVVTTLDARTRLSFTEFDDEL